MSIIGVGTGFSGSSQSNSTVSRDSQNSASSVSGRFSAVADNKSGNSARNGSSQKLSGAQPLNSSGRGQIVNLVV